MKNADWKMLHQSDESWRRRIIGDINEVFVVPRYVDLFYSYFSASYHLKILELGAGTGDLSTAILKVNQGQIGHWTASEYFSEGVEWLRKQDYHDVIQVDACATQLPSHTYDVCVEFDVMHHVVNPRAMAYEMMRLAKGRCLLVESNGLSIFRKLKELTPAHRIAGERSFTPRTWKGFFENHPGFQLTQFEIFPFLFPFRVPKPMVQALAGFNRVIEKVPFLRWQCSSVGIYLEYDADGNT